MKTVSDALMLACNAGFEMNIKRRYILKPYVQKRFQHSIYFYRKKTLLPNDIKTYKTNEGNQ